MFEHLNAEFSGLEYDGWQYHIHKKLASFRTSFLVDYII